ncbi:MAG: DUF262 domain-containing protein [Mesorhizobium sp.]|nr:MAG: DUF262 domain-containing protein [Mesorhizobium sp.]
MAALFIEEIVGKLKRGELRIPAFQRGFVWTPDDVAFLMDSIYKDYPFGSVLLWRTKVKMQQERQLGPFQLPDPQADYPIDYVLDGQQRLTSILGVFADELPRSNVVDWKDIYFDYRAEENAQNSQFLALDPPEVDNSRHFPLNIVFDSVAYRRATKDFDENLASRIDDLKKRFQQAQFPYFLMETEEKPKIAIVFERINRKGVPLDTFQLLTAWTWSEDFELRQQFEELAGELEPFGFETLGDDTDLLLRCTAAVLLGKESAESLLSVSGTDVRSALPRIKKGIKEAIEFLKKNLLVEKLGNLPYPTMLIPLVAFFEGAEEEQYSLSDSQVKTLKEWFWRVSYARRYSSGTKRNLENDIAAARVLRKDGVSTLGNFDSAVTAASFTDRKFIGGTVDTKTFVLLLANQKPRSLVNGSNVHISKVLNAGNRAEFHHLFPQAFLRGKGVDPVAINSLVNFCILSAADNKKVGSKAPSEYRSKLVAEIDQVLASNLIPKSLFDDDFEKFRTDRADLLVHAADSAMGR